MFEFVDLEDSFVLGWCYDAQTRQLIFDLEASLWEGHPYYSAPLPNEFTCYKPARLVFENVTAVDGLLPMEKIKPSIDVDGTADYGTIEGLHQPGNGIYKVSGDFGAVNVACEYVRLDFSNI